MKKSLLAVAFTAVGIVVAACSGGGGGASGQFLLAIADANLVTDGSGTAQTTVFVARDGYAGPITIQLGPDAPAGLTAEPLVLAAGATAGTLVLHASASTPLGGPMHFSIVGIGNGGLTDDALLAILVTGPTGSPDPTFGTSGLATVSFGVPSLAEAAVVMADDSIVLAGSADGDFALARLNTAGALVAAFGSSGRVTLDFAGGDDRIADALRLVDGKIVVAGHATTNGDFAFAVARFTSAGDLDPTFGTDGRVTTYPGFESGARAIAQQSDGKLVVGGTAGVGSNFVFTLIRYESDGDLDASFGGGDGIVLRPIGQQHSEIFDVAVRPDGLIIAGGYLMESGQRRWAVAFFDEDGASIGPVASGTTPAGEAFAVEWLAEGFLVAGRQGADAFIARLGADGLPDSSFAGGDGHFTTSGYGADLARAQNGRLLLAGEASGSFAAWRTDAEGIADTSWNGGEVIVDFGGVDRARDVLVTRDTRVLLVGEGDGDMAIVRLWP